jgi:para-nitrobenzyl esterase
MHSIVFEVEKGEIVRSDSVPMARFYVAIVFSGIVCLCLSCVSAQITRSVPGDPLRIEGGLVSGTIGNDGVKTYLGIPFAAPPIRENRWRAPQPVVPWDGVWTANKKPPECLQRLRSTTTNQYFGDELAGEDCLYLNIWSPASSKATDSLPVIVYIYGGGFYIGSASMPLYAGDEIAKKGVIYVAANYRVGVMGFTAHTEATKESGHNASGNWGLLDQIAALEWVQRNIAAFGGDPNNVTLVGQSAGSMAINILQASPLAKGLFRHIVGMSGSMLGGVIPSDSTLANAEAQGLKLQEALKVTSLEGMRTLSSDKVFAAAQAAGVQSGPIVDGYVLPESVDSIFKQGKQIDVPLLTGSTANDIGTTPPIRAATTVEQFRALALQMYGSASSELLKSCPVQDDSEARRTAEKIGENSGFAISAREWARAQVATGKQPAYLYLFTRVHPFTPGVTFSDLDTETAGAYHTSDVPYWLGTYNAFNQIRRTRDWTAWDRELSNDMQDVIVEFAKTGTPSTLTVKFTAYDPANEVRVNFGDKITAEKLDSKVLDFLLAHPLSGGRDARSRREAVPENPWLPRAPRD